MKKKIIILVSIAFLCLASSQVFGLGTIGEPKVSLRPGQLSLGIDYLYGTQNIKLKSGFSPGGGPGITFNGTEVHNGGIKLGIGLTENLEGFFSLNAGSINGRDSGGLSFVSKNGYSFGFGAKANLGRMCDLDWGASFQMLIANIDGNTKAGGASWSSELDLYEIQIAMGPTYKLRENISLYGGPFIHLLGGDFTAHRATGAARIHYKLEQGSWFGGFVGTKIALSDRTDFSVEYQHTAAANAIGLNLTLKF